MIEWRQEPDGSYTFAKNGLLVGRFKDANVMAEHMAMILDRLNPPSDRVTNCLVYDNGDKYLFPDDQNEGAFP